MRSPPLPANVGPRQMRYYKAQRCEQYRELLVDSQYWTRGVVSWCLMSIMRSDRRGFGHPFPGSHSIAARVSGIMRAGIGGLVPRSISFHAGQEARKPE